MKVPKGGLASNAFAYTTHAYVQCGLNFIATRVPLGSGCLAGAHMEPRSGRNGDKRRTD